MDGTWLLCGKVHCFMAHISVNRECINISNIFSSIMVLSDFYLERTNQNTWTQLTNNDIFSAVSYKETFSWTAEHQEVKVKPGVSNCRSIFYYFSLSIYIYMRTDKLVLQGEEIIGFKWDVKKKFKKRIKSLCALLEKYDMLSTATSLVESSKKVNCSDLWIIKRNQNFVGRFVAIWSFKCYSSVLWSKTTTSIHPVDCNGVEAETLQMDIWSG